MNEAVSRPRVKLPASAAPGETIRIRTLISHRMDSGLRRDGDGALIPRRIIHRFTCLFNGRQIFSCDLDTAIAANPYFEFHARIDQAGTFRFIWLDDDGTITELTREIGLISE